MFCIGVINNKLEMVNISNMLMEKFIVFFFSYDNFYALGCGECIYG
jgi:hypothetical protein